MREIKFRAWKNGRAIRIAGIDFVNAEAYGLGFDIQEAEDCSLCKLDTLEQFTGLRDKDGREIYEGDICRIEDESKLSVVKWHGNDGYPAFDLTNYDVDGMNGLAYIFQFAGADVIEVIGNIHENPDLLGAK